MNVQLFLIEESGREINLSDLWSRLFIQKSPIMYVPFLQIDLRMEISQLLSTSLQNFNKINLQIKTGDNTENSVFELLNWNGWEIANININSSIEKSESADSSNGNFVDVSFIASIENSDFNRRVTSLYLEKQTVEFALKKVFEGMQIKYVSPNSNVYPQFFLPNTRIINAVSYLSSFYDSTCFYIHDFDGIYFYELNDILKNFKCEYEIIFSKADEEISDPKKIKVLDSIGFSFDSHLYAYTLSNEQLNYIYQNDVFFQKFSIKIDDYFASPLGKFKTKMFEKITNDTYLYTGKAGFKNQYQLLTSNTITVFSPKIFLFSELRPGMLIYFNTTSSNFLFLKGYYIILNVNVSFIKDQGENGGMYITLGRFGNE